MPWFLSGADERAFNELAKQSDRAAAVVVYAYLEDRMTKAIRGRMHTEGAGHKNNISRLFAHEGPAGTFSAKSRLAFALGIVCHQTFCELNILRKIRNAFAHNLDIHDFSDPFISTNTQNLKIIDQYVGKTLRDVWGAPLPPGISFVVYDAPPKSLKDRYIFTCQLFGMQFLSASMPSNRPDLNEPRF